MTEENIDKINISGGYLRKLFVYGFFFVFGILTGIFFGTGNRDALKETANLVSQTGKDVFAPSGAGGVSFSLPLKKPSVVKTSTITQAVIPSPSKAVSTSAAEAATTSTVPTSSASAIDSNVSVPAAVSAAQAEQPEEAAPISQPESVQQISSEPVIAAAKLLIFEVQVTGGPGNSEQDFIKIYNPTPYVVDAGGWKIKKRSKTGTESSVKVIPDGTIISSGAVLTWANSKDDFAGTMGAEISSTATISADNSIAISDGDGRIVDAVAWGGGSGQFAEGGPYPGNPEAGQILRRKTGGANLQDTDNNAADFAV